MSIETVGWLSSCTSWLARFLGYLVEVREEDDPVVLEGEDRDRDDNSNRFHKLPDLYYHESSPGKAFVNLRIEYVSFGPAPFTARVA